MHGWRHRLCTWLSKAAKQQQERNSTLHDPGGLCGEGSRDEAAYGVADEHHRPSHHLDHELPQEVQPQRLGVGQRWLL